EKWKKPKILLNYLNEDAQADDHRLEKHYAEDLLHSCEPQAQLQREQDPGIASGALSVQVGRFISGTSPDKSWKASFSQSTLRAP
ncbi:MAG: hypothetical protein WBQ94_06645, partial [Terracidiphilus sp.]